MANKPIRMTIEATIHGHYLLHLPPEDKKPLGLFVGFHGYAQNAEKFIDDLLAVPGARHWAVCAIQGLHRFYRWRSEEIVASWMTSEDRELAIEDNVAYVDSILEDLMIDHPEINNELPLVYAGFSQGTAMACRALRASALTSDGLILLGSGLAPDTIEKDSKVHFPPTLLARGRNDGVYSDMEMRKDIYALESRGVAVEPLTFPGRHEWSEPFREAAGVFLAKIAAPAQSAPREEAKRPNEAQVVEMAHLPIVAAGGAILYNTRVKLNDVAESIDMQNDMLVFILDREAGIIFPMSVEMLGLAEETEEEGESDRAMPDWEREELAQAVAVVTQSDRYIYLPDREEFDEWRAMESFSLAIEDSDLKDRMLTSIHGRGAFRRFKDEAHRHNIIEQWYEFKGKALAELAAEWCEAENIPYE